MSDDLVKRPVCFRVLAHGNWLYFDDEQMAAESAEMHGSEYQGLYIREAATRLATPPGDAVEVVARAIQHVDEDAGEWAWDALADEHKDTYRAFARAALSSIPERAHGEQMREADGWQPIETAPRDGTEVDLWIAGHRVPDVKWGVPSHTCYGAHCDSCPTQEGWHDIYGYVTDEDGDGAEPTHWMPLPLPPAEERT